MNKEEYKWDIFLAHAGADKSSAEDLYDLLNAHCKVFLDSKCLLLGDNWDEELASAQRMSLITVVLVSPRTEQAYYQREELAAAIGMARKDKDKHRVIPVFLDTQANGIVTPYGLRLKHGLYLSKSNGLEGVAQSLLDLVTRLQNRTLQVNSKNSNAKKGKLSTFIALSQQIRPLLKENGRVYLSFGPNSSADSIDPVRWDLTLWEKAKVEVIVPNNREIAELIKSNYDLIPEQYRTTFDEMLTHIYAFEKHCEDASFDYRAHQFPKRFAEIIDNTCLAAALNHPTVSAIENWLRAKAVSEGLKIIEGYIIGSVLRDTSGVTDVDIIILLSDETPEQIAISSVKLNAIKIGFKSQFHRSLHATIFSKSEQGSFYRFAEAVGHKRPLITQGE